MTDRHEVERCELQARAEAIQRQLSLVRRIDADCVADDVRELEVWLIERLDLLEMEMGNIEFGSIPLPQDDS
jgi:hypothetical protein